MTGPQTPTLGMTPVTQLSEEPQRWMLFVHGILGRRANWRGIAKRFVAERPDWGALLVDLRMHGDSVGFTPPHSVKAAAQDLVDLQARLTSPIEGVLGHSFGGKVALSYMTLAPQTLRQVWVIDSNPGPTKQQTQNEVGEVMRFLKNASGDYALREDFINEATRHGLSNGVAVWLAMNLKRTDQGFALTMDLDAIAEMMRDYAEQDLWSVIEEPSQDSQVDLVIAEKSSTFNAEERKRAHRAAALDGRRVHIVKDAGHWLHAEKPDALLELLMRFTAKAD